MILPTATSLVQCVYMWAEGWSHVQVIWFHLYPNPNTSLTLTPPKPLTLIHSGSWGSRLRWGLHQVHCEAMKATPASTLKREEREDEGGWQRWKRREKETSKTTIAERKQTRKKCGKAKRERRISEAPKVLDLIKTVCIYLWGLMSSISIVCFFPNMNISFSLAYIHRKCHFFSNNPILAFLIVAANKQASMRKLGRTLVVLNLQKLLKREPEASKPQETLTLWGRVWCGETLLLMTTSGTKEKERARRDREENWQHTC